MSGNAEWEMEWKPALAWGDRDRPSCAVRSERPGFSIL
jgi:hypothetical protein